ncbi:MAG: hypothetical protein AAFR61_06890 [Bacteroidota bacterium]
MASLKLGSFDSGKKPADLDTYFKPMHGIMAPALQKLKKFRDDGKWRPFEQATGNEVWELQQFLHDAGFLPHNKPTGIFDYVTLAGVRLFQEYVRTIEGNSDIGTPDGIIGTKGRAHVDRWKKAGLKASWGKASPSSPSAEYTKWMNMLNKAKAHFQANQHPVLKASEAFTGNTDTRKLAEWSFDPTDTHLIGIRRNEDRKELSRVNDDLFILLINGLCFKFWGSTDPSAKLAGRNDEPFLVAGQHVYRFGWHKVSNAEKVYKALKPSKMQGVLVLRDTDNDNAFTDVEIAKGKLTANNSINIHWSGIGSFNFSAGCQVIAGQSYINDQDQKIDCRGHASSSYAGLKSGKTMGAYNVLADLIMAYAPVGKHEVIYTLGRDGALDLEPGLGEAYAGQLVDRMKK